MSLLGYLFEILHLGAVNKRALILEDFITNNRHKRVLFFSLMNQSKAKPDRHLADFQLKVVKGN